MNLFNKERQRLVTDSYLDTTKSVLISSPAGSGKTEKLARRYIALLRSGSEVERILAITFTDKAAAEMKERILKILGEEDQQLFGRVREKIPRMRICTIHSFCLRLLKRFSLELGAEPGLEVIDSFTAEVLWSEAIAECLREDSRGGERDFYRAIRDQGIRGWDRLSRLLGELHRLRPNIELGLRGIGTGLSVCHPKPCGTGTDSGGFGQVLALYNKCLERYREKKAGRLALDYNDLECRAFEAISNNPEWQNILYSFDEHTDHILVDEFQDTSPLQWRIIDKLTEEWRSGLGAKRDYGTRPTIFLVGDDKQSIYLFRGADVSIFRSAQRRLAEWLGGEYHFVEARENYRSLPAIIRFVNALFERIMPPGSTEDWRVSYTAFEPTRGGAGTVELLLLESDLAVREARRAEAAVLARRVRELCGSHIVHGPEGTRPCGYGDMAILLRGRTHLAAIEDALRQEGVPFIVMKGVGFYHAPEVAILKAVLFFLIDPHDDHSLFTVLRSPVFSIDYQTISALAETAGENATAHGRIFAALSGLSGDLPSDSRLREAAASLTSWLMRSADVPYAILLEEMLLGSKAWRYFHEPQRYRNAKKFITLVEELETGGFSGLEIREKLIRASGSSEEPKANVNSEGMDAVQLMTIHAAKGLQFPVVFIPGLDEDRKHGTAPVVMDEAEGMVVIGYEDDSDARKGIPLFRRHGEKAAEEEKRLFYVAATRARDYLCMSGVTRGDTLSGKLLFLADAFDIGSDRPNEYFRVIRLGETPPGPIRPSPSEVRPAQQAAGPPSSEEPLSTGPLDFRPSASWLDVTEEIETVRRRHGEDWVVLGRAFHSLFEGLSKGLFSPDQAGKHITPLLRNETGSDQAVASLRKTMEDDLRRLELKGLISEIILPKENSWAELPFILERGSRIYRGRIDRLIITGQGAFLYDYKTYPVTAAELPELRQRYAFQMGLYSEAVERLFSVKPRPFLFFTHEPLIVEV